MYIINLCCVCKPKCVLLDAHSINPADMREFKQKLLYTKVWFSQDPLFVCVWSPQNYVHLLINRCMTKQNQTVDQNHNTLGSYFVIRGKKVHKGISAILLSPHAFCFQKEPLFSHYFVQTLAVTGYSPKYWLQTEYFGTLENLYVFTVDVLVLISDGIRAIITQGFRRFLQ